MENFKNFQLSTEEAVNTLGQGRGKKRKKALANLTEDQRASFKEGIGALKDGEGWADLSKEERKAAKQGLIQSIIGG